MHSILLHSCVHEIHSRCRCCCCCCFSCNSVWFCVSAFASETLPTTTIWAQTLHTHTQTYTYCPKTQMSVHLPKPSMQTVASRRARPTRCACSFIYIRSGELHQINCARKRAHTHAIVLLVGTVRTSARANTTINESRTRVAYATRSTSSNIDRNNNNNQQHPHCVVPLPLPLPLMMMVAVLAAVAAALAVVSCFACLHVRTLSLRWIACWASLRASSVVFRAISAHGAYNSHCLVCI